MKRFGRKVTFVAILAGVVLAATVAWAAWTATGSGTGSAKAITATALTSSNGTATAQLYPTCSGCGDIVVTFDNPNPYVVEITSVSQHATDATHFIAGSGGLGTCTDDPNNTGHPTGVSFGGYTSDGSLDASSGSVSGGNSGTHDLVVPAKSGTDGMATLTLVGTVSMDNTSDNNCQGATFTIPVTFTGTSGD